MKRKPQLQLLAQNGHHKKQLLFYFFSLMEYTFMYFLYMLRKGELTVIDFKEHTHRDFLSIPKE